jgi:penicillin-binding protein 1A
MRTPSRPILIAALVLSLVASACGGIETLTTDQALDRLNIATSRVYDARGNVIAHLHGEVNRQAVSLSEIPEHVRDAVIAIEDQRFWSHQGLDLRSIARAATANFRRAENGGRIEGGSTISQQLAKLLYFEEPDRTLARKLAEAQATIQLELAYSKRDILEMYLNTIYLGRGMYGLETAARSYFRKGIEDLTLSEGAFLAGIIHLPARYEWSESDSPERRRERAADALRRRNVVLHRMEHLGYIPPEEADRARAEPLEVSPATETRWGHPYFVDLVLRQLGVLRNSQSDALDPRFDFLGTSFRERCQNVYSGGLGIYTTLDPQAQAAAEQAMEDVLPDMEKMSAALAAVEPRTGYIRALIGGRDYYPDCREDDNSPTCTLAKNNLALGVKGGGTGRSAGSAFKTFVLAAALERGIPLYAAYDGSVYTQPLGGGADWHVTNYDGSGTGAMTLMDGTARSVNAVYARLLVDGVGDADPFLGSERVAQISRRMGIGFPTPEELQQRCGADYGLSDRCIPADDTPAIALGAKEVSPLDMASAYATLANDGLRVEPVAIARIEDASGQLLYQAEPDRLQALAPGVARGVTHALQQVITGGTGTRARLDRPAAGKTGTSQMWRDAWFAGYTPHLAAAVWVGNATALEPMTPANGYPIRVVGGTYPSQVWGGFMQGALEGVPPRDFPAPPGVLFHASAIPLDELEEDDTDDPDAEEIDPDAEPEMTEPPAGTVPSVVGMSFGSARQAIRAAGFNPVVQRGCDPTGEARLHVVYAQSPESASEAPPGATVTAFYQGGAC